MKLKLEICCYSLGSAIIAEQAGADKIELCDNYSEGGTTPSYATIKKTVKNLAIPVNIIVRPRGGDFLYSEAEYEIIKEDVKIINKLNANGIVIGFLKPNGEINIERTQEIIGLAKPMEVTFHRAFDMCHNPILAMEQLIKLGVTRILTSGARNKAMEGIELITNLVKKSENRIIIMPGSGINETNIEQLALQTGASEFHSSAKKFKGSKMRYLNKNISMGGVANIDEFKTVTINSESIIKMVSIINKN